MPLNRRFSPLNLLLLSINGMIGSAWLFAPLYAARIAGANAIIAWIIGGIITSLIALTFAELSVLLPIAGGSTRFPQLSHGTLTSFIMSWVAWLSSLTMPPIEVQAVLQYASIYFPSLTHNINGIPILTHVGILFATIILLLLSLINIVSFKGLMRSNVGIFSFKIAVILLVIGMLIHTQFHFQNFSMQLPLSSHSHWQAILTAVASGGIAFAFTGFKHGVELAGETKNSKFAIPLSIVGSVLCCLIIYLGLQIAFIGAINPFHLKSGWENLSFSGDVGPFAGIIAGLGIGWLLKMLYIDAILSPLGAGLIYITSTARILYAMGKNGYVPSWLSHINRQHLPVVAIIVNFILGIFLFLPFPGWQAMVNFLVSAMVISYAMGPISLLSLRLQLPQEKRLFRLPAAHFLCLLAFYCCNLITYWTGWQTISKLSIAITIGFIVFLFAWSKNKLTSTQIGSKSILWIVPYLSGLTLISFLGPFGGKNIIPFGWDFLIIAIFSIIILYLAIVYRVRTVQQQFEIYKAEELSAHEY